MCVCCYLFMCITGLPKKLGAHYHNILSLMPDDYELTVGKLQNYISIDQICTILSSSSSAIANKIILDYLIEKMSCREELLDLCDQLEIITTSHDMKMITNELRLGQHFSLAIKIVVFYTMITYIRSSAEYTVSYQYSSDYQYSVTIK